MSDIGERVGLRIRELRLASGLTQAELAERVGPKIAVESISRIERGVHVPSLDRIARIVEALGASMDAFLVSLAVEPPEATMDREERKLIELVRQVPAHRRVHARRLIQVLLDVGAADA